MSILQLPTDKPQPNNTSCCLCGRLISKDIATLGPCDAEGNVTFICVGHSKDGLRFIVMLADYTADERQKFMKRHGNNLMHDWVEPNAELLY